MASHSCGGGNRDFEEKQRGHKTPNFFFSFSRQHSHVHLKGDWVADRIVLPPPFPFLLLHPFWSFSHKFVFSLLGSSRSKATNTINTTAKKEREKNLWKPRWKRIDRGSNPTVEFNGRYWLPAVSLFSLFFSSFLSLSFSPRQQQVISLIGSCRWS